MFVISRSTAFTYRDKPISAKHLLQSHIDEAIAWFVKAHNANLELTYITRAKGLVEQALTASPRSVTVLGTQKNPVVSCVMLE